MEISIPYLTGVIINGPFLFCNIIVNFFYAFCLFFPCHTRERKQPLTVLLGFLILCSLLYCAFVITAGICGLFFNEYVSYLFDRILSMILSYIMDYSIVSYVWLNFYYYIQIVPAPCALFHWVKRNIKCTIYVGLGIDILVTMFSKIIVYVKFLNIIISLHDLSLNDTFLIDESYEESRLSSFYMTMLHYSLMLCITVMSSLSTVRYLHKHMKNMGKSGTSFSATRLRSQMRVTITGTCQGVLFFLFGSYLLLEGFTLEFSEEFKFNSMILYTVNTLFISGTTVTLGIGQNTFRQRIIEMYKALCELLSKDEIICLS